MSSDENDQTPGMGNMAVMKDDKSEESSALVIIVTSHDGEKVAMEAFKDGTHRHLAKPFNMSELTTTIDAYLSRGRSDSKNQANIRIGTDEPAQPEMPHSGVTLRQYNQIRQAVRFINENCGSDICRSVAAQEAGKFKDEIVPLEVSITEVNNGSPKTTKYIFDTDEGPRRDTTYEALANLRPAFAQGGTVTAGNSSQTSDGGGGVVIMERKRAEELGLKPLVRMVSFAVGGVRPEVMGVGPVAAVPKALKLAGLDLRDIDLIELNEAFAAQSVAVIRELKMDEEKVNVNGGAVALGHPLGGTGAKLTVQLMNEMKRRQSQFGMVTMCIGGGMGAAGIFENLQ